MSAFRKLRREVGPAVWLLSLMLAYAPPDWTGDTPAYVGGGNIISDAELAGRLEVTVGTLAAWRRRLRKARLIDWLVKPGIGRVFIIGALNRVLPEGCAAIQELAKATAAPTEAQPTGSSVTSFVN